MGTLTLDCGILLKLSSFRMPSKGYNLQIKILKENARPQGDTKNRMCLVYMRTLLRFMRLKIFQCSFDSNNTDNKGPIPLLCCADCLLSTKLICYTNWPNI